MKFKNILVFNYIEQKLQLPYYNLKTYEIHLMELFKTDDQNDELLKYTHYEYSQTYLLKLLFSIINTFFII